MITVYGADWCEDTRRSRRHLRRLAIAHEYVNIDEDADGLARAMSLNDGARRTPTIDLGIGTALIEPDNETLSAALVELQMLTQDDLHERFEVQNVGDVERTLRVGLGVALLLGARSVPRRMRWPLRFLGVTSAMTGLAGWCPLYHAAGVTSLDGPGDRPDETTRNAWLHPRDLRLPPEQRSEPVQ